MLALAFVLAFLALISSGNGQSVFFRALEFGIENRADNFLEVQPNRTGFKNLDFTICFRCKFWTWGRMVLFETEEDHIFLFLRTWELKLGSLFFLNDIQFPMESLKVSPTLWNSFCLIHNSTNSSVTIAINDFKESYRLNTTGLTTDDISKQIFIGSNPFLTEDYLRFSGQVTDFNFWNRPLNSTTVEDFMSGCSEKLYERYFLVP